MEIPVNAPFEISGNVSVEQNGEQKIRELPRRWKLHTNENGTGEWHVHGTENSSTK